MKAYYELNNSALISTRAVANKNKIYMISFVLLMSVMLIARDVVGVGFNKYIFLAISVLFMFFADFQTLCFMISFLIPLYNGLPGTYIRLVTVILLIVKRKWKIKGSLIGLIVIFALLEFIASLWYPNPNVIDIISYLTTLFMLFFLISISERIDCEKCLEYFVIGTAVFCFVVLVRGIKSSHGSWLDMLSAVQIRFGEVQEDGMHLSANANALAYYCIAGCFSAYTLFKTRAAMQKDKMLFLAMAVFMAIVGLLSLSRSYVIVFLAVFLVYVLTRVSDLKKVVSTLAATGLMVGVVYYLVLHNSVAGSIWTGLVVRFNRADLLTGNGRTKLFYQYADVFFSKVRYMIIGTGVTQYREVSGTSQSIHSMIQQVLVCYGFIGASIFLVAIFRPIHRIIKNKRIMFVNFLPIIAILAFSQTIQFINPPQYMLVYLCGVFAIQAAAKQQTGEME